MYVNLVLYQRYAQLNKMTKIKKDTSTPSQLYIAIDHLKNGTYQLNIMDKNNVVKTVEFKKPTS